MKVINLIGASNTGKSTTAYGLLYVMKKLGINVEYASEYAKDLAYEGHTNILQDQLYILANQNRKLARLESVDYVVTDTCLLLGNVYGTENILPELKSVITAYFNIYDNVTFYLQPNKKFIFQTTGRVQQSREESNSFVSKIESVLPGNAIRLNKSKDYVWQILTHLGLSKKASKLIISNPFLDEIPEAGI